MKRRSCIEYKSKEDQIIDEEIEETEKIPEKIMKHEIGEEEKEIILDTTTTTNITTIINSPNKNNNELSEHLNISEETNPKTTTTLLMAAQLGIKGPTPVGEQPVDKMFNSHLIKEISQHPALFDFTCDAYKSIEARNKHWEEVSSNSGQPLEFIRTRWKTLRDRFKKEIRRIKQQQLQQPENTFTNCWYHFEEMLFLLPFVRDKVEEVIPSYNNNKEEGEGEQQQQQQHYSSKDGITSAQSFIQTYKLTKQRQLNNCNNNNISENQQQQQQTINSCTAAILDLAMNAVNKNKENGNNEIIEEEEGNEEEEEEENNEEKRRGEGGGKRRNI
ncbi:hypothetical protein Mgra_00002243 [Meloidogyne graminicola]|uniref:MADF domain-containing protein n=1 Tax=Meloidogyne graminicola TaxID=189291 RepID=A0A8S9ZYS2_9BILA|nr:hypothetical protein Mgra_00002243 [Meloidogyne graminicola]